MCTLTWVRHAGGYELFFNRDEQTTRGPEVPPELGERGGVRHIAPRDGDSGGTWIAANDRGLTLCLLNGDEADGDPAGKRYESRGLLVPSIIDAGSAGEMAARLDEAELGPYRPFVLVALAPAGEACVFEWDGREGRLDLRAEARMPLISSGVEVARVRQQRAEHLAALAAKGGGLSARVLATFHASHANGPSAYSTCMHREDASTRSHSRILVTPEDVRFTHTPGPPCSNASGSVVRLRRGARP